MPINLDNPLTIPAKSEQIADRLWILNLQIYADNPMSPVRCSITVAPYISSTNEILMDQAQIIEIPDVLGAAAKNQTLGAAMNYIFASVDVLARERGLFGYPVPEVPEPEVLTAPGAPEV